MRTAAVAWMARSPNHGAQYNGDVLSPTDAELMNDVTGILSRLESGDPSAAEQLLPLVYDELRKLASARLAREKPGQTLQPTALVHEAWLKISGEGNQYFANRRHFFKAASVAASSSDLVIAPSLLPTMVPCRLMTMV